VTSTIPELLYHYTSAAGLAGILTSSAIWATDIHYLNDYTELTGSKDRFLEIMRSLANAPSGGNRVLAQQFADRIENERWPDLEAWPPGPFVSCFCENGDLLSQWRGYGRGGYALGFRTGALDVPPAIFPTTPSGDRDHSRPPSEVGLLRVEYAEDAQERILQRAAAAIVRPSDQRLGMGRSTWLASTAAASIKRDAFAEEQEWRYIVTSFGSHKEEFRVSPSGMFIPYVSVPLALNAGLVSVVVGPSDGQDVGRLAQRIQAVRRLLRSHGLHESVDVVPSKVPFREV
jgi:hypothetical protein